jgi:hypothetical protein
MNGSSLAYFDSRGIAALVRAARTYSVSISPTSGLSPTRIVGSGNTLEITSSKLSGHGHAAVWEAFDDFLDDVTRKVATLPTTAETKDALDQLLKLTSYLRRSGVAWLSATRNEINYRQLLDVWFPYGRSRPDHRRVLRMASQWANAFKVDRHLPKADHAGLILLDLSMLIVRLCREVVLAAAELNTAGRSFLNNTTIKMLRLVGGHGA